MSTDVVLGQSIARCVGLLEVGRVKSLTEPAIDRLEQGAHYRGPLAHPGRRAPTGLNSLAAM